MASEEERRVILAEYKASAAAAEDDDEDEADFDPSNHGDYDDDVSYQDDDSSEDDEGEGTATTTLLDYAVLTGSIHLNDEGRVIYSGTWCYHSESVSSDGDGGAGLVEKPTKKHPKFKFKSQAVCHPPPPSSSSNDGNNGGSGIVSRNNGVLFDIHRPTLSKLPPAGNSNDNTNNNSGDIITLPTIPTRRTMIFDGFFFEPLPAGVSETSSLPPGKYSHGDGSPAKHHHHQHGKKIKERDVELFFTTTDNMDSGDKNNDGGNNVESLNDPSSQPTAAAAVGYRISGRGHNDYGSFVLDGTYTPPPPPSPPKTTTVDGNAIGENKEGSKHYHKHAKGPVATIICNKTYGAGGSTKATRSGSCATSKGAVKGIVDEENSGDDDFGDDKAEFGEVTELYEDATMSIEELKRKYYGVAVGEEDGGEEEDVVGDGGGKVAATTAVSNKRPRLEESDDDECGF